MELNNFITTNVEMKIKNFNVGSKTKKSKCQTLHVGGSKDCYFQEVNGKPMEVVKEITYLGDLVTSDAKVSKNIKSRVNKRICIKNEILASLII